MNLTGEINWSEIILKYLARLYHQDRSEVNKIHCQPSDVHKSDFTTIFLAIALVIYHSFNVPLITLRRNGRQGYPANTYRNRRRHHPLALSFACWQNLL